MSKKPRKSDDVYAPNQLPEGKFNPMAEAFKKAYEKKMEEAWRHQRESR